jgi:glycosyltransferase involved in cell wall biosynthesis
LRAVFLTHYFPPEPGAPQTRIAEVAAGLAARGAEVTVHTGFPHYPHGTVAAPYRNRPLLRERAGAVRVVRSAVYPAANRGFARRLADHLAFCASSLATAAASGPADVVVVETPPLFLAASGALYARAKRAPLVLNVADLWPASAVALGALRSPRAVALAEGLERFAYAQAAAISVPTAGIEAALAATGKTARIGPAVDVARFAGLPEPPAGGPLRVLYAGTTGLAQGVGTLLEAAALAGEAVELTVAGGGAESDALARALPPNARMTGVVGRDAVPGLYAAAHAGAVLLRDRPLFEGALPTKLFECMAAGRPVVVAARGEAAELVRRTGCGLAVAPEDPRALADALLRLAADPELRARLGAAGRAAAAAEFSRERSIDAWAALLERAAQGTR